VQALTRSAIERWQGRIVIGHVVMGGNLDILAAMRSTQALAVDLIDCPETVVQMAAALTRLWLRYYGELAQIIATNSLGTTNWAAVWSPLRCYMLQSDFAAMISPKMFRRFVLPDIEECCGNLDHPFYHLDGKGQIAHLDMLLGIHNLKGIQWIPGAGQPPPDEWLPLLKRIRDAGKLCQLDVSPEGARKIVRELGGKGFALFIEGNVAREEATDLLRVLAAEDIS
jgi:5-methyltetrahydrofolate--homocysteine methyltransferase